VTPAYRDDADDAPCQVLVEEGAGQVVELEQVARQLADEDVVNFGHQLTA
jgi:hypothetical protein